MDEVWCTRLGVVPYEDARELQKGLEEARHDGAIPDVLLLLEHPPVYTKGRRAEAGELGMGEDWYRMQGIEVTETDRGGRVTYHGPGQLVGYPIVSLRDLKPAAPTDARALRRRSRGATRQMTEDIRGIGVVDYIRRMERLMIESLGAFGITAGVIDGLTGVWAGPRALLVEGTNAADAAEEVASGELRKIGSIGVHVNRGITTHGFAINVSNDLQPFEWIIPCGIDGCRMTSVCRELSAEQEMDTVMDVVTARFAEIYGLRPVPVEADRLAVAASVT